MSRDESSSAILQIAAGIQSVFFESGFICEAFKEVEETASIMYMAKISSERLVAQLTPKLFPRVFARPEMYAAFMIITFRRGPDYFLALQFDLSCKWTASAFNLPDLIKVEN